MDKNQRFLLSELSTKPLLVIYIYILFFKFLCVCVCVISTPSVGLKVMTPSSRVTCSSKWASQVPLYLYPCHHSNCFLIGHLLHVCVYTVHISYVCIKYITHFTHAVPNPMSKLVSPYSEGLSQLPKDKDGVKIPLKPELPLLQDQFSFPYASPRLSAMHLKPETVYHTQVSDISHFIHLLLFKTEIKQMARAALAGSFQQSIVKSRILYKFHWRLCQLLKSFGFHEGRHFKTSISFWVNDNKKGWGVKFNGTSYNV